jgi:hypothetical protein
MARHDAIPPPRAWYGSTFLLCAVTGLFLARWVWLDTVEITQLDALFDAVRNNRSVEWAGVLRSSLARKLVVTSFAAGFVGVLAQALYRRARFG